MPKYKVETDNNGTYIVETEPFFGSASPKERALSFAVGGLAPSVMGVKRAEESLPMVGQMIAQGMAGPLNAVPGANVAIPALGAGAGEFAKQAVKGFRGEGFKPEQALPAASSTAMVDLAMRGAGMPIKALFKSEIAKEAMGKLASKLAPAKEALRQSVEKIPSARAKDILNKVMTSTEVPSGQQAAEVRRWKNALEETPEISPGTLVRMEEQLGAAAQYNPQIKAFGINLGSLGIKNKAINKALKEARDEVSGDVDALAVKAGYPEFPSQSKQFSNLANQLKGRKSNLIPTLGGGFGLGGLTYLETRDPKKAFYAGLFGASLRNPASREMLYRYGAKPAKVLFQSSKYPLAEAARQYTENQ